MKFTKNLHLNKMFLMPLDKNSQDYSQYWLKWEMPKRKIKSFC